MSKKKRFPKIESMSDLKHQKYILNEEIQERELLFDQEFKRIKRQVEDGTIFGPANFQGDLVNHVLPLALKYRKYIPSPKTIFSAISPSKKTTRIVLVSALTAGLGYYLWNKYKKNKTPKGRYDDLYE